MHAWIMHYETSCKIWKVVHDYSHPEICGSVVMCVRSCCRQRMALSAIRQRMVCRTDGKRQRTTVSPMQQRRKVRAGMHDSA